MSAPSTIRALLRAYLQERRQAGFALRGAASRLETFTRFAESRGHRGPLTLELALRWAQASRRPGPHTSAARLGTLQPFAQFCHRLDPANEVPPAQFFGPRYRRVTPHIYSDREIRSLLALAAHWPPAGCLRAASLSVLFGLLATTGLRLSEALSLEHRDVDLHSGVLHIRRAKFQKSRLVPLHPSTVDALQRYVHRRDCTTPSVPKFFVDDDGHALRLSVVQYAFQKLRRQLRWHSRGGHPAPRIHDLRFTFICRRLERWYAEEVDIDRVILSLCTYVGHVNVSTTYWYLTATPELMGWASRRFQRAASGGLP